jgi:pilus assembly protein CpaB
MNTRKMIMLMLALLVGGVTYYGIKSSQTSPTGAPAVVEAMQVLAAARDLPTGTILKETDMKWIPWSETAENTKLYVKGKTDMGSLTGAVLREGLHSDEPLLMGRVVQPHEQGFLAAVLSPGMRAIAVTLTPSAGVAGFIFPGDHVDVILTHSFVIKTDKNDATTTERRLSETIIQDARVLALDQKSDNQSTDPKIAQLATLEVTPKQAEKMALAADMIGQTNSGRGSISLILRSLATNEDSPPSGTSLPEAGLTMDNDISPVYSRVMQMNKVEVMRGKDVTETTFQKSR